MQAIKSQKLGLNANVRRNAVQKMRKKESDTKASRHRHDWSYRFLKSDAPIKAIPAHAVAAINSSDNWSKSILVYCSGGSQAQELGIFLVTFP